MRQTAHLHSWEPFCVCRLGSLSLPVVFPPNTWLDFCARMRTHRAFSPPTSAFHALHAVCCFFSHPLVPLISHSHCCLASFSEFSPHILDRIPTLFWQLHSQFSFFCTSHPLSCGPPHVSSPGHRVVIGGGGRLGCRVFGGRGTRPNPVAQRPGSSRRSRQRHSPRHSSISSEFERSRPTRDRSGSRSRAAAEVDAPEAKEG